MQPQIHKDVYQFRNVDTPGTLSFPSYNGVKYGRNSLSSILLWNNLKKLFPDIDFISIARHNFKKLVAKTFLDKYVEAV